MHGNNQTQGNVEFKDQDTNDRREFLEQKA